MIKKQNLVVFMLLTFVVVLTTNCASILNDNPERVFITTSPSNAEIYIDGNKVGEGSVVEWLAVERDHYIKAKLGQDERTVTITSHIGLGWVLADVFFTGLFGVIIDAITGQWKELRVPFGGRIHIDLR